MKTTLNKWKKSTFNIWNPKILLPIKYTLDILFKSFLIVLFFEKLDTYLLLLLVKVVNDDPNEQVEGEEGPEHDEEHEVDVHVDIDLTDRLKTNLNIKSY